MRSRSIWTKAGVLAAVAVIAALVALPAGAQETDSESAEQQVLKVGWAQDVKTLNPFVGLNEENFTVWALTWDLLVNFSSEDLSPAPGIAESWEVSDDRKTVTFTLDPDAQWSDGEPITSADVKYSLETLGGEGFLFTSYTNNVTSIETPDDQTVIIQTKEPDARIVGGLFIYMLPERVWGEVPVDDLTGSYEPELPMVGSGPYVVTEFDRERILRMEANPNFRGEAPEYDEIQFIKYGNQDAVERALQLGEIDMVLEVQASTFERLGTEPNIETAQSPSPAYTQLAFNLCPDELCPDGQRNPAVLDQTVRQAIAYSIDRERINEIATRGTSFVAHGILPSWYQDFYEQPAEDYPFDPELANQMLDDAGWEDTGDGPRTKDGEELSFDLYARSESPYTVQMAKLVSEMAAEIGVEFNVQIVSTDKLTELTVQKTDGKPAPDFDSFIWGWGGDPYDPSFLLSILTTNEIGGSSDSFYSNPEYDQLFEEQSQIFDVEERKAVIQEMVGMTQEDLPYIVLTEDPNLQAYRTDRVAGVEPVCPAETGDIFCDQVSYEPTVASLGPAAGASSDDDGGGAGTGLLIALGAVVVAGLAYLVIRSRRGRGGGEPLEFEE
jgi:peptide/nickel transport system substrate-binding protein